MKSIKIGNQEWLTENLNVDHFNNGDEIQQIESAEDWLMYLKEKKPAWCYYENDASNGKKYGKLYNWYAINDPRGLAPKGYHIPSDTEWTELTDYLDGVPANPNDIIGSGTIAGPKMMNDSGWNNSENGTNESGFSALPAGKRSGFDANFANIGEAGYWWSSNKHNRNHAYGRNISEVYDTSNGCIGKETDFKESGFSVRCLKN
ncbi:MAG: fibrobacter succinogenes major paralogous domain-containing protein [Flavobacteriaceae bacterium]|nr:fibrobacter succinogenes major paralogous domain-containing protein [Flavobacteriaceae bacterium]